MQPRRRVDAACGKHGHAAVVQACVDLVLRRDVDETLLRELTGEGLDNALGNPVNAYWLRVWGARGLLWAWDPSALPALQAAVTDEAWRVREMAAKVVARHQVDEAQHLVESLRADPVPRVRAAAARALQRLAATGA